VVVRSRKKETPYPPEGKKIAQQHGGRLSPKAAGVLKLKGDFYGKQG